MMKNTLKSLLIAAVVAVGSSMITSSAHAQNRVCLALPAVNKLVQTKKITSFNKVKRMLQLPKNAKIFNQRLCQVEGKYVYFFKVVDAKGKARGMALGAIDGKPFPNKG